MNSLHIICEFTKAGYLREFENIQVNWSQELYCVLEEEEEEEKEDVASESEHFKALTFSCCC
jgi:hypothetical protein